VDRRRVGVVEFPVKKTVVVGKREREREREGGVITKYTTNVGQCVFVFGNIFVICHPCIDSKG